MSFRYNQGGEVVEIIIRDVSGAKIESYKFHVQDKQLSIKIMNILKYKYGVASGEKTGDEDINWLRGDTW